MGETIVVNGNYYVLPFVVTSANIFDRGNGEHATSVELGDIESVLNDFAALMKENRKLKESLETLSRSSHE